MTPTTNAASTARQAKEPRGMRRKQIDPGTHDTISYDSVDLSGGPRIEFPAGRRSAGKTRTTKWPPHLELRSYEVRKAADQWDLAARLRCRRGLRSALCAPPVLTSQPQTEGAVLIRITDAQRRTMPPPGSSTRESLWRGRPTVPQLLSIRR